MIAPNLDADYSSDSLRHMSAKSRIAESHTDDGLDSARTDRTVFTERTADLTSDAAPDDITARLTAVLEGTVPEVTTYLDEHPEDRTALRRLERKGHARKGILDH